MKSYPHCPFRRNRLALSVAGLTLPLSLFSLNTQAQSVEEADERIPVVLGIFWKIYRVSAQTPLVAVPAVRLSEGRGRHELRFCLMVVVSLMPHRYRQTTQYHWIPC